jgi:hypothetical protein
MVQTKPYAFDVGERTRRFATLELAEIAARVVCAKAGENITIEKRHPNNGRDELMLYVRRDAFDRIWSDLCPAAATLL